MFPDFADIHGWTEFRRVHQNDGLLQDSQVGDLINDRYHASKVALINYSRVRGATDIGLPYLIIFMSFKFNNLRNNAQYWLLFLVILIQRIQDTIRLLGKHGLKVAFFFGAVKNSFIVLLIYSMQIEEEIPYGSYSIWIKDHMYIPVGYIAYNFVVSNLINLVPQLHRNYVLAWDCFLQMYNFIWTLILQLFIFASIWFAIHYSADLYAIPNNLITPDELENSKGIVRSILYNWQMLLGENPAAQFKYEKYYWQRWAFYIVFTLWINIIFLNLMIAVTGEIYEEAMFKLKIRTLQWHIEKIDEFVHIKHGLKRIFCFWRYVCQKKEKPKLLYVHRFMYKKDIKIEEEDKDDLKWEGRVLTIQKKISKLAGLKDQIA